MVLQWELDSCWCIYEIDDNFNLISVIQKCTIHDHMGDVGAFNSAKGRNIAFNNQPSKSRSEIAIEKFNGRKTTKP